MTTDIFLRTYHKDLEWLGYALKSIHKYVTGYRRIVIAIPKGEGHLLSHLTAETVIEVPDMDDGYIGQQLTKMRAYEYTDAGAVIFWDSDVVATQPIDIHAEYFHEGKPILYKTRYASMDGNPWQPITAKAVGFTPEWEYMRRMPITFRRDTLMMADTRMVHIHHVSLSYYLSQQPFRAFSEFNVMGALAEQMTPDRYHIVDTETVDMPPNKVMQGWSWGGITDEVKATLKNADLL